MLFQKMLFSRSTFSWHKNSSSETRLTRRESCSGVIAGLIAKQICHLTPGKLRRAGRARGDKRAHHPAGLRPGALQGQPGPGSVTPGSCHPPEATAATRGDRRTRAGQEVERWMAEIRETQLVHPCAVVTALCGSAPVCLGFHLLVTNRR